MGDAPIPASGRGRRPIRSAEEVAARRQKRNKAKAARVAAAIAARETAPETTLQVVGARLSGLKDYPAGWWLMILRSRFAPWIARALSVAVYAFAAGADFDVTPKGWPALAVLVLAWLVAEWVQTMMHGAEIDSYTRANRNITGIISSLAGFRDRQRTPRILEDPNETIRTLLQEAKDLTVATLKPPAGCEVSAHLLVPESNGKKVTGLRATTHDKFRPDRRHDLIPLDAPGAGDAFSSGKARAVAYTGKETHTRVRGRPYKSIGAFPIAVGESANNGRVVAVLSLDADQAHVFSQKRVDKLDPFVSPIAQLIGLAMELRNRGDVE